MHVGTEPLLEHLSIFRSRSAEETRAFLRGKNYGFEIRRKEAAQLDARINGIYMPGAYIGYVQYGGTSVALSPGRDRTDYWVQLPLRGRLKATIGKDDVLCDPNRAAIASPVHESCRLVSDPDSSRIQLALTQTALLGQLAALLGEPPTGPLNFATAIDLSSGYGRSLARYVLMAVADLEQAGSVLWNSATMTAFEQFLTTALLQSHPHNYSKALQHVDRAIAPRDVKRAIDFMEANLRSPLRVPEIVHVCGVPGRTLFKHFRDCKGIAPMQYLRNARFLKVRQALLRAEPEESVTAIALSWGFSHLGRFSADYRRRYGESPSQTIKTRRAALRSRSKN